MKLAFTTYAAVLQLVAILLLQYYPIASHLGHKPPQPQCMGNHAQCGCAPEHVASRTCCCFRHKPASCDMDRHHDEECATQKDGNPAERYLSAAPCGTSPKFITASLDKLKFLRPEALQQVPSAYALSHSPSGPETAPSRSADPPDLPPKLALPA